MAEAGLTADAAYIHANRVCATCGRETGGRTAARGTNYGPEHFGCRRDEKGRLVTKPHANAEARRMTLNEQARHGAEALSSQAKAGVMPIPGTPKPEKTPSRWRRPKPLKPSRKRHIPTPEAWFMEIRGSVCVACEQAPAEEAHHIIRVQVLRREAWARKYKLEDVIWDRRNRLPLCKACHADHHSGKRRLSHDLLYKVARWVYEFAEEHGVEHALEREYTAPVYARACRAESEAA